MRALFCGALSAAFLAVLSAQIQPPAQYLAHDRAAPVLAALDHPVPAPADWPRWIAAADAATRARVAQGDERSIVNLLLFGTSFTKQPRIASRELKEEQIQRVLQARLDDFERAIAQPAADERLRYVRRLLGDGAPLRPRLLSMIEQTVKEAETLARLTADAQRLGDPSLEFAERSRLYRDRGLASDTSVRINFAIEEALRGLTPVLVRGSDPKLLQRDRTLYSPTRARRSSGLSRAGRFPTSAAGASRKPSRSASRHMRSAG